MKNRYIYWTLWDSWSQSVSDYVMYEVRDANQESVLYLSENKEFRRKL